MSPEDFAASEEMKGQASWAGGEKKSKGKVCRFGLERINLGTRRRVRDVEEGEGERGGRGGRQGGGKGRERGGKGEGEGEKGERERERVQYLNVESNH